MPWFREAVLLAAVVLGGLLVAACSSSRPLPAPSTQDAAAPAVGEGANVAEAIEGYKLGPGDQVRLTVFRHEDLSGEFELDGEGTFAMPLVGEIDAMGLTAREVEDVVEEELRAQGYLVSPQASIEVLNYRPFYIIGEVRQPGSYPYVSGMTVINAVALAGGFTYRADQDDIIVNRGGSEGRAMTALPETEVLPGDVIEVPERFF